MKKFRMNIKAAKFVFAATLAVGMFGCQDDLLNPIPKTQIDQTSIFASADRVGLVVNGMYTLVKSGQVLGGRAQVYGDVRANDFINRTSNGVTAYLVWQQTLLETSQNDVINLWGNAYSAINDINIVIDGLTKPENQSLFVPPLFPATFLDAGGLRDQYVAEAKFLRAVTYFTMLQFYAQPYNKDGGASPGLVLRLLPETSAENNLLARATVAECYAQILKDLNEAEAGLPATQGSSLLRVTRAHKNTAIAYKTRVYLNMSNWDKVIEEASKLAPQLTAPFSTTSGSAQSLVASVANVFASPQENTEMIFAFPFTAQNTPGTQNQLAFYYRASAGTNPGGGEFGLNTAAGSIVADETAWPLTDARRAAWVYKQGTETYLGKYPSGTPYLDKAPVIRYSEVLLNYAEALSQKNGVNDAKAIALLNAVRTRSGSPAYADAAVANILTERRIEFLGEGLRNWDITRNLGTFPGKGSVPAVAPTAPNYIWPIPITERAVNTAVVPN